MRPVMPGMQRARRSGTCRRCVNVRDCEPEDRLAIDLKRLAPVLTTLCAVSSSRNANVTVVPLETERLFGEKAMFLQRHGLAARRCEAATWPPSARPAPMAQSASAGASGVWFMAATDGRPARRGSRAGALRSRARRRQTRARRCRVGMVTRMSATFIFLMVVLKLPIFALLYIVWWAIHADARARAGRPARTAARSSPLSPRPRHPHPRPALPRNPRRGPHGAPRVAAAAARAHGRRPRAPRRALTPTRSALDCRGA